MLRVLTDTSFLIYIANNPSPILRMLENQRGRYKLIVPSLVIDELKGLIRLGGRRGRDARNALKFAENQLLAMFNSDDVDQALLSYAHAEGLVLATLDTDLLKNARDAGVATITPRRGRLLLEGITK